MSPEWSSAGRSVPPLSAWTPFCRGVKNSGLQAPAAARDGRLTGELLRSMLSKEVVEAPAGVLGSSVRLWEGALASALAAPGELGW